MTEEELDKKAADKAFATMRNVCDSGGITRERLVKKLSDKLDAKDIKPIIFQGLVKDKIEIEAHDVQLRAVELSLKARGELTEKHQIDGDLQVEIINYADSDKKAKP